MQDLYWKKLEKCLSWDRITGASSHRLQYVEHCESRDAATPIHHAPNTARGSTERVQEALEAPSFYQPPTGAPLCKSCK